MFFRKKNTFSQLLFFGFFLIVSCKSNNREKADTRQPAQSVNLMPLPVDTSHPALDNSPMDMAYFPENYPMLKMNQADTIPLVARVIYSRPKKNGRIIFGANDKSLCQYGREWRLGANEATEIELFKPVVVNGKKIAAGRYVLYCIPQEDKWSIVFNSNLFTWGLHLDSSKDVAAVEIPVNKTGKNVEIFTMEFKQSATGVDLIMVWDDVKAILPFSY